MNFPVAFISYLVLRSCLTYHVSRLIYLITLYILTLDIIGIEYLTHFSSSQQFLFVVSKKKYSLTVTVFDSHREPFVINP